MQEKKMIKPLTHIFAAGTQKRHAEKYTAHKIKLKINTQP
jgi:hypothetical protein